ncbi:putative Sulfide:quinone oxidoreductase mitochondrial precursor [Podospora conica]|nr:putative Sulfide:quinone oxidoreductase mitochondrial precursor [Schizothecium conicum]
MASRQVLVSSAACAATAARHALTTHIVPAMRAYATHAAASPTMSSTRNHKVVVVGGGSAGLNISHQLLRQGKFSPDDIAIVDPAEWHDYQPGWTLVGGGLKDKTSLRRPLASLIDAKLRFYNTPLASFSPDSNSVTLGNGDKLTYEQLVVAPGIKVDFGTIKGLPEALKEPSAPVSSIYSYDTCDKADRTIKALTSGAALFTQPAGVIKCAGAPQKVMWLALDRWRKAGLYTPANPGSSPISITFATGLPTMFGVPKYSAVLEKLRQERGVEGLFGHDLVEINGDKATFMANGQKVVRRFDLLHATPKMGPHAFVKSSPLANEAGYVDVDDATLRHKKWSNVWSAGDASSLPTSKTAAAITAQSPVLVQNLLKAMEGKDNEVAAAYDGYTSCPLLTGEKKVLLAEFKYAGVPKETFGSTVPGMDQATPRMAFYYLKKDFFPWVYYKYMVKGQWGGPKGWIR